MAVDPRVGRASMGVGNPVAAPSPVNSAPPGVSHRRGGLSNPLRFGSPRLIDTLLAYVQKLPAQPETPLTPRQQLLRSMVGHYEDFKRAEDARRTNLRNLALYTSSSPHVQSLYANQGANARGVGQLGLAQAGQPSFPSGGGALTPPPMVPVNTLPEPPVPSAQTPVGAFYYPPQPTNQLFGSQDPRRLLFR